MLNSGWWFLQFIFDLAYDDQKAHVLDSLQVITQQTFFGGKSLKGFGPLSLKIRGIYHDKDDGLFSMVFREP